MAVVINCDNAESTLQHKSMDLSYNFVRENAYDDILQVIKIRTDNNVSDSLTKGLDSTTLNNFTVALMSN